MINLYLSIGCSALIFIIFKYFEKVKVHNLGAIVVNYFIAGSVGVLTSTKNYSLSDSFHSDWFFNAIILGVVFISLFNIMAVTTQKFGAPIASIANKMALVIPVVFAIIFYNEEASVLKIIGITLALFGLFFSTFSKRKSTNKEQKTGIWLPILLFIGSGFIDTFLKYSQGKFINSSLDAQQFSSTIFFTAFSLGLIIVLFKARKEFLNVKTLIAGTILGIVNYGSIFFLVESFSSTGMESSVIFPINNMGVVLLAAIASYFVFKEKLSKVNLFGLALSLVALLIISQS